MKVRNFVCAVLMSVLSASAFAQGKTLAEREADLARREAAVKEAELKQREAAVAEREKALNNGQPAEQPASAEAPKRSFLGRMLHPNEKAEQDASSPKKGGMTRIIGVKDGLLKQQEVTVVTLGQDYTTIRTDGGETWQCRTEAVRNINGSKAKVKNDSLTNGDCTKSVAVASNTATVASPTDYVTLHNANVASNGGGTKVSVVLAQGVLSAMEVAGDRRRWGCKKPLRGDSTTREAMWSAKDFADRGCKEQPRLMMPK